MGTRKRFWIIAVLAALTAGLYGWFLEEFHTGDRSPPRSGALELQVPDEGDWKRPIPVTLQGMSTSNDVLRSSIIAEFGEGADFTPVAWLSDNSPFIEDLGAVGRIDFYRDSKASSSDSKMASCTGVAISETHVLTAGHCFYDDRGNWRDYDEAVFWMNVHRPKDTGIAIDLDLPKSELEALSVDNELKWTVRYDGKSGVGNYETHFDYAIIPFRNNQYLDPWAEARTIGISPVQIADVELKARDELYIGHHPGAKYQMLSSGAVLCRIEGAVDTDLKRFQHNCDTQPGSSGAPVFSARYRVVVGIHVCCDMYSASKGNRNEAVSVARIAEDNQLVASLLVSNPLTEQQRSVSAQAYRTREQVFRLLTENKNLEATILARDALHDLKDFTSDPALNEPLVQLKQVGLTAINKLALLSSYRIGADGYVSSTSIGRSKNGEFVVRASAIEAFKQRGLPLPSNTDQSISLNGAFAIDESGAVYGQRAIPVGTHTSASGRYSLLKEELCEVIDTLTETTLLKFDWRVSEGPIWNLHGDCGFIGSYTSQTNAQRHETLVFSFVDPSSERTSGSLVFYDPQTDKASIASFPIFPAIVTNAGVGDAVSSKGEILVSGLGRDGVFLRDKIELNEIRDFSAKITDAPFLTRLRMGRLSENTDSSQTASPNRTRNVFRLHNGRLDVKSLADSGCGFPSSVFFNETVKWDDASKFGILAFSGEDSTSTCLIDIEQGIAKDTSDWGIQEQPSEVATQGGRLVAVTDPERQGGQFTFQLADLASKQLILETTIPDNGLNESTALLRLSPNGENVAVLTDEGRVLVWSPQLVKSDFDYPADIVIHPISEISASDGGSFSDIVFSNDSKKLLVISTPGQLNVFRVPLHSIVHEPILEPCSRNEGCLDYQEAATEHIRELNNSVVIEYENDFADIWSLENDLVSSRSTIPLPDSSTGEGGELSRLILGEDTLAGYWTERGVVWFRDSNTPSNPYSSTEEVNMAPIGTRIRRRAISHDGNTVAIMRTDDVISIHRKNGECIKEVTGLKQQIDDIALIGEDARLLMLTRGEVASLSLRTESFRFLDMLSDNDSAKWGASARQLTSLMTEECQGSARQSPRGIPLRSGFSPEMATDKTRKKALIVYGATAALIDGEAVDEPPLLYRSDRPDISFETPVFSGNGRYAAAHNGEQTLIVFDTENTQRASLMEVELSANISYEIREDTPSVMVFNTDDEAVEYSFPYADEVSRYPIRRDGQFALLNDGSILESVEAQTAPRQIILSRTTNDTLSALNERLSRIWNSSK